MDEFKEGEMLWRPRLPNKNFVIVPNELARCKIKPEAIGVLVYLLSHRDDWRITNKAIANHFNITTSRVTRIADDLVQAGYVTKYKTEENKFDWLVTIFPDASPLWTRDKILACTTSNPKNVDQTNVDPKIVDPKNRQLSNNIDKRILSSKENEKEKKTNSLPNKLESACPEGVPLSAWRSWWKYKRGNRTPSDRMIKEHRIYFAELVRAGHTQFDTIVDLAISRKWAVPGKPSWSAIKELKQENEDLQILGLIE